MNLGSEEVTGLPEGYGEHLLAWLGGLRALRLRESDLVLIAEPVRFRDGPHEGSYLIFDHGGVEIGEGIRIDTVRNRPEMQIFDFGFGLERLLWVANGTPVYEDNLGPISLRLRGRHDLVDAARTVMLMTMAGVTPGHRAHSYRLRTCITRLRTASPDGIPVQALKHSFEQWCDFLHPSRDLRECMEIITGEVDRQANLELCERLGIRPPRVLSTDQDSFAGTLLQHGIHFSALLATARSRVPEDRSRDHGEPG